MPREKLLRILALLILGIAALHLTAVVFYLYWTLWWYDLFLHALGGAFAALLALWLLFFSGYFSAAAPQTARPALLVAVLSALFIGIGWEFFERALGNTWSIEGYWLDTALDLFMDVFGAFAGFLFFVRRYLTLSAQRPD